jgi:hypothetical protein
MPPDDTGVDAIAVAMRVADATAFLVSLLPSRFGDVGERFAVTR